MGRNRGLRGTREFSVPNPFMIATKSQKRRLRLIRQLETARQSLQVWDTSLRTAIERAPVGRPSVPSDAAVLLAIVSEAMQGINRRLAELGVNDSRHAVDSPKESKKPSTSAPTEATPSLNLCVSACRACGRALSAAFREAQSVADAASARVLYGPIRALEKQLWVLDPSQAYLKPRHLG